MHKSQIVLEADPGRVILQPLFLPGSDRVERILKRVEGLSDDEVRQCFQRFIKNSDTGIKNSMCY